MTNKVTEWSRTELRPSVPGYTGPTFMGKFLKEKPSDITYFTYLI